MPIARPFLFCINGSSLTDTKITQIILLSVLKWEIYCIFVFINFNHKKISTILEHRDSQYEA